MLKHEAFGKSNRQYPNRRTPENEQPQGRENSAYERGLQHVRRLESGVPFGRRLPAYTVRLVIA